MHKSSENFSSFLVEHVANGTHWKIFGVSFDLSPYRFEAFGCTFQLTQDMVMVAIATLLCLALLIPAARRLASTLPANRWGHAIEATVLFVRDEMVIPFVGEKHAKAWLPFALTLFFFILSMNLVGLIPYLHSATGNISVTAALALVVFLLINVSGMWHNGVMHYLKGLAPSGLPAPMLLFIYPIELVSLISKSVTLAIRLFANMAAGHFLVFSLLGLMALMKSFVWGSFSVPLAVVMYGFDVFVAFLQAYIFTLLSMLFIGSAIQQEH